MQYDPFLFLLIGIIILLTLGIFFFPVYGIFFNRMKKKTLSRHTLAEDALKHIFDCEYTSRQCSIESIAGTLSVSRDDAAAVITYLADQDMVSVEGAALLLTQSGRQRALRIIRTHRVYEQYLADTGGLKEREWHSQAEQKEHSISPEEAERIAARLGNPLYDPHGDPIPTITGELPPQRGVPFNEMKPGQNGYIVHLEDEPETIYAQITALGLHLGMRLTMIEISESRASFLAGGEERILAPLFCANISVQIEELKTSADTGTETLSSLPIGETAVITGISQLCRGPQRRRLMDFGFVPGTEITAEQKNLFGDPVAYRIKSTTVALRKTQAELIYINRGTAS